jgi:hypothetical protein
VIVETAAIDAINGLGLLNAEAVGTIIALLTATGHKEPSEVAAEYLRQAPQVTGLEKAAIGVPPTKHLSVVAIKDLSPRGLADPLTAHEQTLLRAASIILRHDIVIECDEAYMRFGNIRHLTHTNTNPACDPCHDIEGLTVRLEESFVYPPVGCECTASYILVPMEI